MEQTEGRCLDELGTAIPKYRQVKNHLLLSIKNGRVKPGETLPTEMELARTHEVARSTVRQALDELDREKLIYRVRGKGTFVGEPASQLTGSSEPRKSTRVLSAYGLIVPLCQIGEFPSLLGGFDRASSDAHNQVIVSTTDNDISKQGNAILQLVHKRVAGIAMVPTSTPTPAYQIQHVQNSGIPVVLLYRGVEGVKAPLLVLPHHDMGRTVAEAFLGHGHRQIAFFSPRPDTASLSYVEGIRTRLRAGGVDLPDEFVFFGDVTLATSSVADKTIQEATCRIFGRRDRPTAVMASYDTIAESIYIALQKMGLRVPEDVSIIGVGGKNREGALISQLTSVTIDGTEVGRLAAGLLGEMNAGRRAINDSSRIVVPLGMSDGRTLGPAPTWDSKEVILQGRR